MIQAARDPLQAVRLGRAAAAIVALAFLISAAAAVFDPEAGWLSLSGVLATCTPTVIFLAASLNPSGASVAAGIALCASLLRIGRPAAAPAWVWTLLGCSGAMLLLSHPTGLAWTALLLAGFIALESPSTARRLVREQRRAAALGIGLLALGVLAALVWQGLYGPITPIAYRGWGIAFGEAPSYTWHGLLDLIAGFGYLEFRIPLPFYLLWFAFVGVMAALAIRVGSRRERRAVIGAGVLAVLLVPAVWSVFGRAVGIGIIGREYLPVLAGFPMLCGEVLYRQRAGSLSATPPRWRRWPRSPPSSSSSPGTTTPVARRSAQGARCCSRHMQCGVHPSGGSRGWPSPPAGPWCSCPSR